MITFRYATWLSLDDCLFALQRFISLAANVLSRLGFLWAMGPGGFHLVISNNQKEVLSALPFTKVRVYSADLELVFF